MSIADPCSCLVLHLHISGRQFGATTPSGASPHICAFYLQFVTETQTTVPKIDDSTYLLYYKQRRSQPATTTTTTTTTTRIETTEPYP